MERRRVGPTVRGVDHDADVVGGSLRVRQLDIEVPRLVEDTGVDELELVDLTAAPTIRVDELRVRELAVRILVEPPHEGVGGGRVERPPVLLHVLAVVSLGVREPEQTLLQDLVVGVPERQREAQVLPVVADAAEAVLTPSIGPGPGVLVGEEVPRVPAFAVVLPDRPPLAGREVRTPPAPQRDSVAIFFKALLFSVVDHGSWQSTKDPWSVPG